MKIVIDATPVAHGNRADARHTKNLIEALVALETTSVYDILYYGRGLQSKPRAILPAGAKAREITVPFPARLLVPFWRTAGRPRAEFFLGSFDVFYATNLYFPPSSRGVVLGTIRGIGYHVIQDKLIPSEVTALSKGLIYTLAHADYLLAVSRKTREELMERLGIPDDRIYVVPHGVDPRFTILSDRDKLSERLCRMLGFSTPYILYVGVIGHHKNIMGILNAYAIVRDNGFDVPLVLAGPPGSAWNEAQTWIAQRSLQHHVHLTGMVDQATDELTDLYNGACLFVFPSFYEGWTSPPLEAMACGTPVITSNCSSLPETVGDAAIQVNPNETESLAHEMQRVLSDQDLQLDLVRRGAKHVASHGWTKSAAEFAKVFAEIHARGRRRAV